MKFKFIHKIFVIQDKFLFFLTCSEGRIPLLRGPNPARGPRVVHACPIRHYFKKEFLNKTIFYSVHPFAHIRQHYCSNYWGGPMHGPSPTSILGGPFPQSPQVSAPV